MRDISKEFGLNYLIRKPSSSPSYTLAEIRSSMEEFLNDMQNRGHVTTYGADSLTDWKFETYLQWLAKWEQGKGDR